MSSSHINKSFNQENLTLNIQNEKLFTPYSTSVLVLGILSIIGSFIFGLPGLIMGIIALIQSKKGIVEFNNNSNSYTVFSYDNLKAGKICAIVGIALSTIMFLLNLIYLLSFI